MFGSCFRTLALILFRFLLFIILRFYAHDSFTIYPNCYPRLGIGDVEIKVSSFSKCSIFKSGEDLTADPMPVRVASEQADQPVPGYVRRSES